MRWFLLLLSLFGCGGGGGTSTVSQQIQRADRVLFGYYGGSLPETVDHISVQFASTWFGQNAQLQQVIDAHNAGLPVMLDVADQMGLPFDPVAAEARMVARLQVIQGVGALSSIVALYFDEPDLNNRLNAAEVTEMAAVLRRAYSKFGISPKLAVAYTANFTWPGVAAWDWVGIDNYGGDIFTNGDYAKLKAVLRPDQRIILVAGGADPWKADSAPFAVQASDPQVIALLVFSWTGGNESGRANGWGAGVRSNGMAPQYKQIGLRLK